MMAFFGSKYFDLRSIENISYNIYYNEKGNFIRFELSDWSQALNIYYTLMVGPISNDLPWKSFTVTGPSSFFPSDCLLESDC